MIFYFSGTGNSQKVAQQMAHILGDELIFINRCIKDKTPKRFYSDKPLIFIAPTYAWQLPKIVEHWISNTDFEGNRNAYFVLTCGGSVGNAAVYAKALCQKKNFQFCGLAPVMMPENYLALFPTPSKTECQKILEQAKPVISLLAGQIQTENTFPDIKTSLKDKFNSGPVNLLFYPLAVRDKGFTVSETCISCNQCAKRCPLNNIKLVAGKPIWNGHCTHCMACIAGCPMQSIEYKNTSKGQHRHFILEDMPAQTNSTER